MTQILTTITKEYVLLVADRRLTFLPGPMQGQVADDDACKLVSLCNICGIGYTGLAQIEAIPTHEWIAKVLALEQCSDPAKATQILTERANAALSNVPLDLRRQTFVIVGWTYFQGLTGLRPFVCAITNMLDPSGAPLPATASTFSVLGPSALKDGQDLAIHVIGQRLRLERGQRLERNLHKLVSKEISAKAALRLLVDEVIHTSGYSSTVGNKVLGLCIPRRAVQSSIESGRSVLLAAQPNEDAASFCYYDPTYSELQQYGPTITCGGSAVTDVKTENDPSIDRQSSQLRILALPKSRSRTAPQGSALFKRPSPGQSIIGFEFGIAVANLVVPNSICTIPAAIRNTGDLPINFAKSLSDKVGQEVPPSKQGGAVPAITFAWPAGGWSISGFQPVSWSRFAGVVIAPGVVFEFNFGSFRVPVAPMGSKSHSRVVDLSISFTDAVRGTLLNVKGPAFNLPTNVNPTVSFRISRKSARSRLSFYPARVVDTGTGELISGPVEGSPPPGFASALTDTAICAGKPGIGSFE